jgi:hypothetical protein
MLSFWVSWGATQGSPMKFIFVFLLVTFVDFIWAKYIAHIAKSHAIKASLYSGLLTLISSLVTIAYVGDHRMIIPAALGALVGTYLAVKLDKK